MVLSLFVNMCNPRVFGDNAYDPDVNASELWIDKRDINGKTCLTFTDNGNGLVQEKLHKMLRMPPKTPSRVLVLTRVIFLT
eukprot:XP_011456577.1 PREDICTED: MORC family CW-type zinc finger protein 3-like isoform X7 [Crassostrea gigas]